MNFPFEDPHWRDRLEQKVEHALKYWAGGRLRFLVNGSDGFDCGAFVWRYRRFGPVFFYRDMLASDYAEGTEPPLGPWCIAVAFTECAAQEFYEGASK